MQDLLRLAGCGKSAFYFLDRPFALNGNREAAARAFRFYTYHFALARQADRSPSPERSHIHGQFHMGMNGNGVARFQQHAADADVFADGLEFAKGATQREA